MRRRTAQQNHHHRQQEQHPLDIFDELEIISSPTAHDKSYNHLFSLTTEIILSEISLDDEVDDDGKEHESHTWVSGSADGIILATGPPTDESFVSIYELLSDSHRAVFLPSHGDLLERLKHISSRRCGFNKKTGRVETYSWRSPDQLKTFKEGGRLFELAFGKSGQLGYWYLPFYGYCDEDLKIDGVKPKRVCCLLCKKLNLKTLQPVRSTLIRHFKTHHHEYFSLFCSNLAPQSFQSELLVDVGAALKNEPLLWEWKLAMAQASFVFKDLLPFRTVCNGSLSAFSQLLHPHFVPFNERRLIDCLLFSLYGPSFQFVKSSVTEQLDSLPNSIVLRLDLSAAAHTTCPAMIAIGCGISWLDKRWTRREYFIRLKLLHPPSFPDDIQILPPVAELLTSLGIEMSDCCALTIARSPLICHSLSSDSDSDLEITCVEDFFSDLVTLVAQAFLNDELSSHPGPAGLTDQKVSLIQTLQKANYLIHLLNAHHHDFFLSDDERAVVADLRLERIDWENLISISSSLSSLLQCSDAIRNLLSRFQDQQERISAAADCCLLPTEMDWELWGELVSILEPLNSVSSLLLQGRGECHLSLLWYIVDWVVCIYDQTSDWEVFSVRDGKVISIPTRSLSQPILAFRSSVVGLLRESYLTDSLMMTHPRKYELVCLATLLDPRTKDFGFFRSSSVSFPPYVDYPALYSRDARSFILIELRTELCSLLEVSLEENDEFPQDSLSSTSTRRTTGGGGSEATTTVSSRCFRSFGDIVFVRESLRSSSSHSTQKPASLTLRKCIDEHCRKELLSYENEPMICLPHQIRHYDPLTYWLTNSQRYPILSRVARRFLSIRMVPSSLELKGLAARVLSKNHRKSMCPVLFEAVSFLHLNGILDSQFPERS